MKMKQCIDPDQGCVGCSACYAICPRSAIRMNEDANGFYIPKIDRDLCISCGRCVTVCPLKQQLPKRDYAEVGCMYAFAKNTQTLHSSTSGGVASAFAEKALKCGGIACGCSWDEGNVARHVCTDDVKAVASMRGSKYVQSDMGDCFREIKQALEDGRFVLFTGTPCQTTALHSFLGKSYSNLITCALICGGVPSPKVLDFYIRALEKRFGSKLVFLNMRSKIKGWIVPHIEARFANGKSFNEVLSTRNLYGTNFMQGLFLNESCMNCQFKLDTVQADLLLGDHWGINRDMLVRTCNNGASVILVLTPQGKDFIASLGDEIYTERGELQAVINSHHVLTKNHIPNAHREAFFEVLKKESIIELLEKHYQEWKPKNPIKRFFHECLYRTGLYTPLFTIRWKMKNRGK